MQFVSLGKVTVATAGTPVQVSATRLMVRAVRFQTTNGNTGLMYIGDATLVKATLVGVHRVLGIASATADAPVVEFGSQEIENGNAIDLSKFWVDAGVNGESVLVSYAKG